MGFAMSHDQISEYKCPKCGENMEPGYITGQWSRLRWCKSAKTKTIFAGEPLRKKRDLLNAPTVEATRCVGCNVGVFAFDD